MENKKLIIYVALAGVIAFAGIGVLFPYLWKKYTGKGKPTNTAVVPGTPEFEAQQITNQTGQYPYQTQPTSLHIPRTAPVLDHRGPKFF